MKAKSRKPKTYDIDELMKFAPLGGTHLSPALRRGLVDGDSVGRISAELACQACEPTGNAKYVQFVTLQDPKRCRGKSTPVLEWPYVEGLRMDEAMHPLTILAVGLYGEALPAQNGAPIRSGRALEIRLQEHQVHRQDPLRREAATDYVEHLSAAGIWLLLQREPGSRSSALEPGDRTAHRRIL